MGPPAGDAAQALLDEAAAALVAGVGEALPGWALREVTRLLDAWAPAPVDAAGLRASAAAAGLAAAARVSGELAALLAEEPDAQRATPLEILRTAVAEPTLVLRAAGVPEVVRDPFAEEAWPDDVYGLTPKTMRDLSEDLAAVHFAWGRAKAAVLRSRRPPPFPDERAPGECALPPGPPS